MRKMFFIDRSVLAFNTVQENVFRGGQRDYSRRRPDGCRMPKSRAIKGIDEDLKLNKALWHVAELLRTQGIYRTGRSRAFQKVEIDSAKCRIGQEELLVYYPDLLDRNPLSGDSCRALLNLGSVTIRMKTTLSPISGLRSPRSAATIAKN
jgi:hypothetical protein